MPKMLRRLSLELKLINRRFQSTRYLDDLSRQAARFNLINLSKHHKYFDFDEIINISAYRDIVYCFPFNRVVIAKSCIRDLSSARFGRIRGHL